MKVTVTINPDGTTDIDVDGVVGSGCEKYTEAVIRSLGGKKTNEKKKPEYYQEGHAKLSTKN
jgi:hypothetical protein